VTPLSPQERKPLPFPFPLRLLGGSCPAHKWWVKAEQGLIAGRHVRAPVARATMTEVHRRGQTMDWMQRVTLRQEYGSCWNVSLWYCDASVEGIVAASGRARRTRHGQKGGSRHFAWPEAASGPRTGRLGMAEIKYVPGGKVSSDSEHRERFQVQSMTGVSI